MKLAVSAPGKIILFGEHAVVFGKVNACINFAHYGKIENILIKIFSGSIGIGHRHENFWAPD